MRYRRLLAALVSVAVVGGLLSALAAQARPTGTAVAAPARVKYALDQPVCSRPTRPGQFACMALRRVMVPKGTPDAHAYTAPEPSWLHGPAGGLTPAALAKAYGYDPATGGSHQTVAIVDWYDDAHLLRDLNHFNARYGLPPETPRSFRRVNENGNAAPLPPVDADEAIEISLDVQTVRAVCNHCRILLVEAAMPTSLHLARAENTAVRLGATEISNSFGLAESPHGLPSWLRSAFYHPGVVITASTGDDGWYGWDYANDYVGGAARAPEFPASSPWVISVGGTALRLNTDGTRKSETVWNSNGADNVVGWNYGAAGAGDAGCSTIFAAPFWQHNAAGYSAAGCQGKRLSADMAADADPATGFDIYDSYGQPGWETVGGTSLSAPIVAAMWALAGGAGGIAHPARTIYRNFRLRPSVINDVTAGGDSWCGGDDPTRCAVSVGNLPGSTTNNPNVFAGDLVDCSFPRSGRVNATLRTNTQCNAAVGLDGPSGVGTPNGVRMFRSPLPRVTITAPAAARVSVARTYRAAVVDPLWRAHVVKYVWTWGDRSGATTVGSSATGMSLHHAYKRAGRYTVALTVTDSVGQSASTSTTVSVHK